MQNNDLTIAQKREVYDKVGAAIYAALIQHGGGGVDGANLAAAIVRFMRAHARTLEDIATDTSGKYKVLSPVDDEVRKLLNGIADEIVPRIQESVAFYNKQEGEDK